MNKETETIRNHAITAGISLLIMAVAAAFAYGFAYSKVVKLDDMSTLYASVTGNAALFRAGLIGWLVVLVCDIVVACSLYAFLEPVNRGLSLLALIFRLIYVVFLSIAIICLMNALGIAENQEYQAVFRMDQINAAMLFFIGSFNAVWSMGLILFGLHLCILGYVLLRSKVAPGLLGLLLILAAESYVYVHFFHSFLPQFDRTTSFAETILSIPMSLGELAFGVWLLVKGGKAAAKKT